MAPFSANFFLFKPDFDLGMMTCHDMFDMFSLTCLSCDMGAWHCFSAYFCFVFNPDFDHGMLACRNMFDMASFTCLSCDMGQCSVVLFLSLL